MERQVTDEKVSVPLRGVGCFVLQIGQLGHLVVSVPLRGVGCFPLPRASQSAAACFRPLAGCRLFLYYGGGGTIGASFRPLAGCRLFRHQGLVDALETVVSVPLRGVDCFSRNTQLPLTGSLSFYAVTPNSIAQRTQICKLPRCFCKPHRCEPGVSTRFALAPGKCFALTGSSSAADRPAHRPQAGLPDGDRHGPPASPSEPAPDPGPWSLHPDR